MGVIRISHGWDLRVGYAPFPTFKTVNGILIFFSCVDSLARAFFSPIMFSLLGIQSIFYAVTQLSILLLTDIFYYSVDE